MTEQNKDLLELIMKFNKAIMKYQFINFKKRGPNGNPERGQGRVLSILKLKSEITQKELAFILDMRNQSLGELLTKLEAKGFITREQSENDKRVMVVRITKEGKEAASSVDEMISEIDKIFSCLSKVEQENMKVYLTKLIEETKKHTPEFDRMKFHEMYGRGKCEPHDMPHDMDDMRGGMHRGHGPMKGHRGFDKNHPFPHDHDHDDHE